ncbi:MAG: trypsin-like serine protease [Hydrococcus sp. RU_2_2]|nr:trypsin-like serine protease [Hydrococcus sp. RU_2_2]NJP17924.1 trypsin-like serine protease [Hydrococcus sp. CRU_1_1]
MLRAVLVRVGRYVRAGSSFIIHNFPKMVVSFESKNLASELNYLAEQLQASTVEIGSDRVLNGSGTIWRSDGLIITNAHVIRGWQTSVKLSDGRVLKAKVTAQDPQRDLAVLRVDATDLPAVTVGDTNKLRVGELVLAVGNPLGITGALTMGIVHSLDGEGIEAIDPARQYDRKSSIPNLHSQKWIVADLQLAPGNSGGPLANVRGEVIGINTAIAGGLALAIPTQEVERFLNSPHRLTLGVTMRPILVPFPMKRVIGWWVLEVAIDSLAMAAGLVRGDIILCLNGTSFRNPEQFAYLLGKLKPGDRLLIEFLRDSKRYERSIVIGKPK